ncbi:hypothetical protein HU200_033348 [Digitaria exilis]|uniref:Uncharacterized protein n=1 Tax=Digitaria exilis TaxID=1010633 RepID=A0A835BLJ6_9POAL|nr:hypothetical protein HU200_033348 [Digitaria exilis]
MTSTGFSSTAGYGHPKAPQAVVTHLATWARPPQKPPRPLASPFLLPPPLLERSLPSHPSARPPPPPPRAHHQTTPRAMALLSDAAAFYTWGVTTWLFTASVVVAIVRCWARGRGLRVEDVFTGFRAPLLLAAALLSQVSLRLYTIRVSIPQVLLERAGVLSPPLSPLFSLGFRQRRGQDATGGVDAAVEGFLTEEAYVWPVGVCMFCLVALLISRAYAARRRRAAAAAPPPRVVAGQRTGSCSVSVPELVLFLFCVWTCAYSFPVMVREYMAATANGSSDWAA